MSIGWVMFWKGVVVAVGAAILERYRAFKKKRREAGLPVRFDKRRNAYVVDDRLERVETWAKRVGIILAVLFALYGVLVFYLIFTP